MCGMSISLPVHTIRTVWAVLVNEEPGAQIWCIFSFFFFFILQYCLNI